MKIKKHKLSLSNIYKLEYEEQGLGNYFWIYPGKIEGFNHDLARSIAQKRSDDAYLKDSASDMIASFGEAPDMLITDYLGKCLNKRMEFVRNGKEPPTELNITPVDYIEALLFLICNLGSAYACHILGATHFHNDDFFSAADAEWTLNRLRSAMDKCDGKHEKTIILELTCELFYIGHPWGESDVRFGDILSKDSKQFLQQLKGGIAK